MNLNQLRVFYAAAREGSYTRAADILYVTQPAVSQAIKALEAYYGVGLFKKAGRAMELTSAGRVLFGYAEHIFGLADEAERAMRELSSVARGELRVAVNKIYARYLMPSLVSAFRERYPGVDLVLDEGSSEEMVKSVERLSAHVGLVGRVPYPSRIRAQLYRLVDLVLVAGPAHSLSQRDTVCWRDLDGESFIIREKGSSSRHAVLERFSRQGLSLNVALESGSVGFIKEFVAEGKALAFLLEADIREELAAGRLVKIPLADGNLELETDVVMLADAYKSPAVRAFLGVLEESATAEWSVLPLVPARRPEGGQ